MGEQTLKLTVPVWVTNLRSETTPVETRKTDVPCGSQSHCGLELDFSVRLN